MIHRPGLTPEARPPHPLEEIIMARRTHGSVRFDPYFKVQVWQPRSLAWRDIQKAHDTEEAGWAAAAAEAPGELVRLMEITPSGRTPGEPRQMP